MSENTIQQDPAATTAESDGTSAETVETTTEAVPTSTESSERETTVDDAADKITVGVEQAAPDEPSATETVEAPNVAARVKKSRLRGGSVPALGKRGRLVARAAVVLALAASLGSSIVFHQQDAHHRELLTAQEQARAAACKYAPLLATYDAKNLDAYVTGVLDGATGDWRKQFDSTSKDLRDVLTQGQVVSKATDVQCAVRSADRDSAEAIVVIGQTITSLGTQGKPAPGQLSMVMRLERSGDRWLVNKVNSPLAQPPQS
ncbi:hypothetical protein ACQP1O_21775 [Nocardia sp. CA-151230]|uniref:hypothetical protein n=1 Tax=Nocardia sp. CA-151230 TaxID=3239982 RepID=UPI003D8CD051